MYKRQFRYRDKERFKDIDKLPPAELYEFCRDIIREEMGAGEKVKRDKSARVKGSRKYSNNKAGAFVASEIHAGYNQQL